MEMINPFLEQGEMVLQTETHEIFADPHANEKLINPYNGMFHGVPILDYTAVIKRDIYTGLYQRILLARATSVPVFATTNAKEFDQFITWLKAVAYQNKTELTALKTYEEIIKENELTTENKESDTGSDVEPGHPGTGDSA